MYGSVISKRVLLTLTLHSFLFPDMVDASGSYDVVVECVGSGHHLASLYRSCRSCRSGEDENVRTFRVLQVINSDASRISHILRTHGVNVNGSHRFHES